MSFAQAKDQSNRGWAWICTNCRLPRVFQIGLILEQGGQITSANNLAVFLFAKSRKLVIPADQKWATRLKRTFWFLFKRGSGETVKYKCEQPYGVPLRQNTLVTTPIENVRRGSNSFFGSHTADGKGKP